MQLRIARVALWVGLGLWCWYGMMLVHELGHVLGAVVVGARVEGVRFGLFSFSGTDVGPTAHEGVVVWCGFVVGSFVPLAVWGLARLADWQRAFLLRAFAGFCLLANGVYLGSAIVVPAGDTEELLRLGVPGWVMGLAGVVLAGGGVWMFAGQGERFGLKGGGVERGAVAVSAIAGGVCVLAVGVWSVVVGG